MGFVAYREAPPHFLMWNGYCKKKVSKRAFIYMKILEMIALWVKFICIKHISTSCDDLPRSHTYCGISPVFQFDTYNAYFLAKMGHMCA